MTTPLPCFHDVFLTRNATFTQSDCGRGSAYPLIHVVYAIPKLHIFSLFIPFHSSSFSFFNSLFIYLLSHFLSVHPHCYSFLFSYILSLICRRSCVLGGWKPPLEQSATRRHLSSNADCFSEPPGNLGYLFSRSFPFYLFSVSSSVHHVW